MFMFSTLQNQPHLQDYYGKHVRVLSTGLWGQCFTWPFASAATRRKLRRGFHLLLASSGSWTSSSSADLRERTLNSTYWAMKSHQSSASFCDCSLIYRCKRKQMIPVGKLGCSNNKQFQIVFLLFSRSLFPAISAHFQRLTSLAT